VEHMLFQQLFQVFLNLYIQINLFIWNFLLLLLKIQLKIFRFLHQQEPILTSGILDLKGEPQIQLYLQTQIRHQVSLFHPGNLHHIVQNYQQLFVKAVKMEELP